METNVITTKTACWYRAGGLGMCEMGTYPGNMSYWSIRGAVINELLSRGDLPAHVIIAGSVIVTPTKPE